MTDQDEQTIKQHMGDIHRSFLAGDVATLNRILADDFSFSDPAGPIVGKEQWLADLGSGDLIFESIDAGPVEYHRAGEDTHEVSGETTIRVRYSRSNYNGTFRYKGIFRRRDGIWKLALASARAVDPGKLIREKR